MKKCQKILGILLIMICSMCIFQYVDATTITAASSVEKGKSVTITVTVPNVNTVDLTATVSGAGTSGTIRIVDGSLTGEAKNYSKSITVTPTSAGIITVSVTGGSNAVLNGQYVNVAASKNITVTEPVVKKPTTNTNTNTSTNKPAINNTTTKPSTTTTNTNKNTNTNPNKSTSTNTATKSSNANLKNMILSVEGLTPAFSKDITNYSLTVGENVNEIKVNGSVEHSRASYSVTGNTNLKDGENVVTVKVTAEDGTVKTYKINVIKSEEPVKLDATLASLIIEDVNLGQTFDPNVTEYNAGDITVIANKLNIYAYPNNENAKVEIIGNENLVQGEHKVTVRVTSENGKVVKDYVVSFNKLYAEESIELEKNASKVIDNRVSVGDKLKDFYNNTLKDNMTVIILYLFVWIEFIQIVYLYEKLKKHEDVDKITVGKRIKSEKVKKEKIEKPRREKVNPIFPDDED